MLTWTGAVFFLGCQANWWSRQVSRIWRPVVVGQVVFVPVFEELFFRGILPSTLNPLLKNWGVVEQNLVKRRIQITSVLSGILHGFFGHSQSVISRVQLSVFAGIGAWFYGNAYEKHSLGAATLLHGTYNSITLALAMRWGSISPWIGTAQAIYLLALCLFRC